MTPDTISFITLGVALVALMLGLANALLRPVTRDLPPLIARELERQLHRLGELERQRLLPRFRSTKEEVSDAARY